MTIKMTREEYFNKLKDNEEHDANLILVSRLSFATCDSCEECIFYQDTKTTDGEHYECTLESFDDIHGKLFSAIKKQLALL